MGVSPLSTQGRTMGRDKSYEADSEVYMETFPQHPPLVFMFPFTSEGTGTLKRQ